MSFQPRGALLKQCAANAILCLDGATGTALQNYQLTAADFGGEALDGCNEHLVLTRPDVVQDVHRRYLEAGADIIETNSFGSTAVVLREYGLENQVEILNVTAARLAREIAEQYSTPEKPRFVAGSMGPTSKSLCITGGITFAELITAFADQAAALLRGGVDYLLLETWQDTLNLKAALIGCTQAMQTTGLEAPIAVSITIEPMGTMLAGQGVEALYTAIGHYPLLYVGLNCATGPEFMTDHIRTLSEMATCGVACVPNAGLPDEQGIYQQSPADFTAKIVDFARHGWLNFVGGCCGTTDKHIAALSHAIANQQPRCAPARRPDGLSGIDYLPLQAGELYLIGERTNVIGSRKFKRLIADENIDEAVEVARKQVRSGAHIIDICLANPDRDEFTDMQTFLSVLMHRVKVPLMIDSTDPAVIAMALQYCQGRGIINSINLEQGEERFGQIIPLIRQFGAAVVVGTIDEDPEHGMAVTVERKLEIAERSYQLLTEHYGLQPEDIIFDPLVFPVATGDVNYRLAAKATIDAIRLIRQKFPRCHITIGLSNVSFGLPPAAREIVNSIFLHHCVDAGLNMPIINTEMMVRYSSIAPEDKQLAEDLLFARTDDPITPLAAKFKDRSAAAKSVVHNEHLSIEEKLVSNIVEGSKEELVARLEAACAKYRPLEIINGPLMEGMATVGKLFNENQLIVAEVLQSAEVMKAAVDYLSPKLDKSETVHRGTMVLATVKGDVHDIGKNLVDIILTNNGFKVINLGIKIPSETILAAVREHSPDFIGLSGLLVRSAQQMIATASDLRDAGINVPIFVGGAALSENFAANRIQPEYNGTVIYSKDPMECFATAQRLIDPNLRADFEAELSEVRQARASSKKATPQVTPTIPATIAEITPPTPPDFERHIVTVKGDQIREIFEYINPAMLFGKHLGFKGYTQALESGDPKALKLRDSVQVLLDELVANPAVQLQGVYQYYRAQRTQPETVTIYVGEATKRELRFPRDERQGISLADYHRAEGGDNLALMAVTAGATFSQLALAAKDQGEYLRSHIIWSLALELAEGFAEWLHYRLRAAWGIGECCVHSKQELFSAKYRGRRYAPGYPAIPDMARQRDIFALLAPEEIGITLTESDMMDPEASVSCVVLHHPQAKYF
ncbi:methionine synthase [Chrysiogenes arsenatis]|uniref:methionine synthase n=1 Tax=Chrysiogenes arsenatis TaxID=309797 RepID=UPI000425B928|nr:methionine synthase [Chrysiogenes arsenatis]